MADLFSWQRFLQNFPVLIIKLPVTFEIVAVAFSLGFILALLIATARIKKIPVLNQILTVFISFERGTPLLVQMLVVYYALPQAACKNRCKSKHFLYPPCGIEQLKDSGNAALNINLSHCGNSERFGLRKRLPGNSTLFNTYGQCVKIFMAIKKNMYGPYTYLLMVHRE